MLGLLGRHLEVADLGPQCSSRTLWPLVPGDWPWAPRLDQTGGLCKGAACTAAALCSGDTGDHRVSGGPGTGTGSAALSAHPGSSRASLVSRGNYYLEASFWASGPPRLLSWS